MQIRLQHAIINLQLKNSRKGGGVCMTGGIFCAEERRIDKKAV